MRRRGPATSVPTTSTIEEEAGVVHEVTHGVAATAVEGETRPPLQDDDDGMPIKPDSTTTSATSAMPDKDGEPRSAGMFECNICFETPRDPIVTRCGHLYCWGCVYRWMRQRAGGASQCPVCKASISPENVVPIYGRGRTQSDDPRSQPPLTGDAYPPRPPGQRTVPGNNANGNGNGNNNGGVNGDGNANAGLHPYWHPAAAFGRNVYAGGGHGGNLALTTFGNFPSLFGMEIAYPQLNEHADNHPRLTPEQETREQVAKIFLLLALFIIAIITFF